MSWHKQTHRMTFIHQAVLTALFGLVGFQAHAITLSQADIHSSQHEPLSATIAVSDIDANNFNVSIASADIYAQMGLSPEAPINVRFNATSESSGQIILTSSAPISTPFADVVLNLNNNGEQVIEPQTLLMPIPASSPFIIPENEAPPVVITEEQQNLPTVSPLVPELPETTDLQASAELPTSTAPTTVPTAQPATPPASGRVISQADEVITQKIPEGTNKQVDILTEQVTRSIYPAGQAPQGTSEITVQEPALTETPKAPAETSTGTGTYVVQSGDSLWNIANQIAKANNMSVGEVMNAIHKANPDAFNRGNINHLKANATLNLPNYSVIPSQKAIQDAISTRRQNDNRAKQGTGRASESTARSNRGTQQSRASSNSSSTTASNRRPLPRAQMTLVTPNQQGRATGTSSRATQSQGAGDGLAGTLRNTRQQTVNTAQRVNSLNQELSTATQRLQLQNQKLAELEARLKALKENQ